MAKSAEQPGLAAWKTRVKAIPLIGAVIRYAGGKYHEWKLDPVRNIRAVLGGTPDVYVVQIGSNDGKTGDPIHSLLAEHPSWRALLVEPVPFLFDRLKRNYADASRFRFENVAIAEHVGTSRFYYVDERAKEAFPGLPTYFDQLGSFTREHITRHLGAELEPFIITVEIPTVSLAAVLTRNRVERIDLLHIDTEGYDWAILRQLDLAKYAPKVILFEHKHLSNDDKREARSFLNSRYRIVDLGFDYFCRRVTPR